MKTVAYRKALVRGLAALMAVTMLRQGAAYSAPSDLFQTAAPVIGADAPRATAIKAGDASVSTQTGALSYSYPVQVPPGRNGMAPTVRLSYSSQAPMFGGIASGWSMDLPAITEDLSAGRLRTRAPEVEAQQQSIDAKLDDRFVSSIAGGRRLVMVNEPASSDVYGSYRAMHDTSFSRYQRMHDGQPFRWRVLSVDGSSMTFGETNRTPGCTNVADRFAPLTGTMDAFGNEVRYEYESVIAGECRIKKISWGYNANASITQSFAQVEFAWNRPASCTTPTIEPGSQRDYRTGSLIVMGASKLSTITATAFPLGGSGSPEHTRLITLAYASTTEACNQPHAPVRILESLQESAWGTDSPRVDLPPVNFQYGPAVSLTMSVPDMSSPPWGVLPRRTSNLAWGYRRVDDRWPTVEAMLVDVDGDGLLDRMTNSASDPEATITSCSANWQRNVGSNSAGQPMFESSNFRPIPLPRLKWRGSGAPIAAGAAQAGRVGPYFEGCALNGQVTAFKNSNETFNVCHASPGLPCANDSDPLTTETFCYPGGTECPAGDGGPEDPNYRTYLAYRWLDADSDGLVDLVAAVHGDIDHYDIGQGNALDENGLLRPAEPELFGQWPACPTQIDRCKDLGRCMDGAQSCTGAQCTMDWGTVNSCLITQPTKSCFDILARPAGGGTSNPPPTRAPYTRCEGLYPWLIYKNQGNGAFATTPIIEYQPVPLESDQGDSAVTGPGVSSQHHAVMDFDGDGFLDAVAHGEDTASGNPHAWYVWLGDGTGGFGSKRYVFPTRNHEGAGHKNAISGTGGANSALVESWMGLFDMNGDTLPDHWLVLDAPTANANITFHDGARFAVFSNDAEAAGELNTPQAVRPANDTNHIITSGGGSQPIFTGTSSARSRTVDVDGDGRLDFVAVAPTPWVYFNAGGQFITAGGAYPHTINAGNDGLKRSTVAEQTGDLQQTGEPYVWELDADLIDLDGNGIAENVYFDGNTFKSVKEASAQPPRLLFSVDNGRGVVTAISYAQMHDTATVVQSPAATWTDVHCAGCPKASPRQQWVVKTVTATDRFAATTTATSYKYTNPRYAPDEEGHHSFRGFEEVTATMPSAARTVQRYGYDVDWTGRLVASLVYPSLGESATDVRFIDKTTWSERQLFGGAIKTYHATLAEHFTCALGQTEATCTPSAAPGYSRTTSTLTPLASDSNPGSALIWQETASLLQAGTSAADGDRMTSRAQYLFADASTYRLRPTMTTRQHRVAGAMTTFAQSAVIWDASYRVPEQQEVWFGASADTKAIARSQFDLTTGNVERQWKPIQSAANTTSSSFQYDARKLFAIVEINELGHQRDHQYEYGTGALVRTDGPNVRECTTDCPIGTAYPVKEQHKTRIDGMGRPIEQWDTVSDDGHSYTLEQRSVASYVDTATATVPTSATHHVRLSTTSTVWKQETTDLDGHGRPTKTTVLAQGSAQADQVTVYAYANDGTLKTVEVPDPTGNGTGRVAYSYGFDSLGRPKSVRRPDALSTADKSGVDIRFNGVTQTTTEILGVAGGNQGITKTIKDDFGRLVQVQEQTVASPATWATTTYTHGPDDNVATIVDSQGVTTTLKHDFAGQRTEINRGTRAWRYTYNKNGNVESEQVPGSSGPLTDAQYMTTIIYDDLDRPLTKTVGQRALTPDDQRVFAAKTETFEWDVGGNMKGYLRYWKSYAPGGQSPAVTHSTRYTNQGQLATTIHQVNSPGFPSTERRFQQLYHLFGGVAETRYEDRLGGTNRTISKTHYDARGLPSHVVLSRTGEPQLTLATQTRNVAGLVLQRRTDTSGPMTFAESIWTYDKLGRVSSQLVQTGPGPTQVVRQDLTYFGNDDPQTMSHALGTSSKQFQYGYDLRHQLKTTTESTTPGYFSASYDYGTAGRLTRATHAQTINPLPAGSEVKPRDVNYVYGGADPEQVTSLTTVSTRQTYASYTYDEAGNQTTRSYPATGELWEYVYDGKDQLRRATRKLNGVVQGAEEYWYDGAGQRLGVVTHNSAWSITKTVWFVGDTEAHHNGSGVLTKIYSHVSLGTPVARVERTADATTSLEFQFHGLANNTSAAVAQNGTINATFSYTPFGEVLEATNAGGDSQGTLVHTRRFNDKVEDDLTGLGYYGARYFDKTLIGWTQADPLYVRVPDVAQLSTPRRANTYQFSLSNPLRYLDPDGLDSIPNLGTGGQAMCSPSPSGRGCGMESGPAAYERDKAWLTSSTPRDKSKRGAERAAAAVQRYNEKRAGTRLAYAMQTKMAGFVRDVILEVTGEDIGPNVVEEFIEDHAYWALGKLPWVGWAFAGVSDAGEGSTFADREAKAAAVANGIAPPGDDDPFGKLNRSGGKRRRAARGEGCQGASCSASGIPPATTPFRHPDTKSPICKNCAQQEAPSGVRWQDWVVHP